jgi:putative transcriptional regulator
MSKLGKKLVRAAKEARSIARAEAKASTYRIHPPDKLDRRARATSARIRKADAIGA